MNNNNPKKNNFVWKSLCCSEIIVHFETLMWEVCIYVCSKKNYYQRCNNEMYFQKILPNKHVWIYINNRK